MTLNAYFYKHPLIFLQIGGWTCYIIIDIFGHIKAGYYLYEQSIAYGLAAFILTSCVALLSNRNMSHNIIRQSLYFVVLLYLASIIWHKIYKIIHIQVNEPLSVRIEQTFGQNILDWFEIGVMPMFLFLAWGGLYVGCKWYLAHQSQHSDLDRALIRTKQAQLATLRYQLNPHFLFNVLNSIDVSILNDDKETAHNMLKHLSRFLRQSLQEGESNKITLEREFDLIRSFIAIEQVRFADSLELEVNLDLTCRKALLPPMLLQPLVENAIKHAWSKKTKGYVSVLTSRNEQELRIVVRNSKAMTMPKYGVGIGLNNTRERLQLVYGNDASIVVLDLDTDFEVEVKIPWEEHL